MFYGVDEGDNEEREKIIIIPAKSKKEKGNNGDNDYEIDTYI